MQESFVMTTTHLFFKCIIVNYYKKTANATFCVCVCVCVQWKEKGEKKKVKILRGGDTNVYLLIGLMIESD